MMLHKAESCLVWKAVTKLPKLVRQLDHRSFFMSAYNGENENSDVLTVLTNDCHWIKKSWSVN